LDSGTRASLVVLSASLSGVEIAERLGNPGDRCWDKGSATRIGSATVQKWSGWEINSRLERTAPAIDHLRDVIAQGESLGTQIRELVQDGAIDNARVWLHLDSPTAGFSLEPELLRWIAAIGSLEVDIYS